MVDRNALTMMGGLDQSGVDLEVKVKKEKDKIEKDLEDRIEENNNGSNEDLANKIGSSFGVDVIAPENSDE